MKLDPWEPITSSAPEWWGRHSRVVNARRNRPHSHQVRWKGPEGHSGRAPPLTSVGMRPRAKITGIRSCISAISSFAVVVMIAKVRCHSPELGSFQFSQTPARPNGAPSLIAMAWGCFAFSPLVAFHSKKPSTSTMQRRLR